MKTASHASWAPAAPSCSHGFKLAKTQIFQLMRPATFGRFAWAAAGASTSVSRAIPYAQKLSARMKSGKSGWTRRVSAIAEATSRSVLSSVR